MSFDFDLNAGVGIHLAALQGRERLEIYLGLFNCRIGSQLLDMCL